MTSLRSRSSRISRALWVASAVFLGGGIATALVAPPAQAANDGSDWGPNGATGASDSAVTVRWDNAGSTPVVDQVDHGAGNAAGTSVPSQILPYTGGAVYANVNSSVSNVTRSVFQNLALTVNQTQNLTNQADTISFTGVTGNGAGSNGPKLDVMQCWGGGTTVDGVSENQPDPTHCESGIGGVDTTSTVNQRSPILNVDRSLIAQGDLAQPTVVTVSGWESPDGTTVHLYARVNDGTTGAGGLTPMSGTVQFQTAAGQDLGAPVTLKRASGGVASTTLTGLTPPTPGQTTSYTASFTPAAGENFTAAPPGDPVVLPNTGSDNGGGLTSAQYPRIGELYDYDSPGGLFNPGDHLTATMNKCSGTNCGTVAATVGTATAAADGSASIQFGVPTLPGGTYVFSFTDATTPADSWTGTAQNDFQLAAFQVPPVSTSASANTSPGDVTGSVPFNDIAGSPQGLQISDFSAASTNEMTDWEAPSNASSTTTRQFTFSTTVQDPGLGCGVQPGRPSTATCWLVAVPEDQGAISALGGETSPLSPAEWAQRLQVQLSFQPISGSCSSANQSEFGVGSELLSEAMTSWTTGLCNTDGIDLNYSTLDDSVARQQYSDGSTNLIFTSQPVDDSSGGTSTLYAPAGLAGVTVSYLLPTASGQLTGIKLNARLIVKLLTESYVNGITPNPNPSIPSGAGVLTNNTLTQFAPWAAQTEFADLFADPEFRALNPGVSYTALPQAGSIDARGTLIVTSTLSDPVAVLWKWLLSDPQAKAFLDGCPDTASTLGGTPTVINPYFSTEKYTECSGQATTLQATATTEMTQTTSAYQAYSVAAGPALASLNPPESFNYTFTPIPPVYSATSPQFPQPQWFVVPPEVSSQGASSQAGWAAANTLANINSSETSLAQVETQVERGANPSVSTFCLLSAGTGCTSGLGTVGKWTTGPTTIYNAQLGLTDSPAAAQFQTTTAQLCDDNGSCVGANTASLQKAEADFDNTSTPGVLEPSMVPDEADGAYPLTVPIYAEINTDGLDVTDAAAYAKILSYISTTGNIPGLTPGSLPPGYAPLTADLLSQDAGAIATLDELANVTPSPSSSPTPSVSSTPSQTPSTSSPPQTTTPKVISADIPVGGSIHLTGTNYPPGRYTVLLDSKAVVLGTTTVGKSGILDVTVMIPSNTSLGLHDVLLELGGNVVQEWLVNIVAAASPPPTNPVVTVSSPALASTSPPPSAPTSPTAPAGTVSTPPTPPTPSGGPSFVPVAAVTPSTPTGFPEYGLIVGVGGALLCAVMAPIAERLTRKGRR